ncbi:arginase family protein [Micromonospora sp. WMMD967]|uniref:arginase family protein n=1 Tax=Micromonospora sp. WMMD967 TaxID=3016101 RepID=UPI00241680A3|nr:arginase family protein [Micromonospora sp. WMMD967]MDG4839295.1 arginase family protein [Micromonospora sp. WMMD967]
MWNRDLDVLVPMWQGADDSRVREGAAALGALTEPATRRVTVPVPAGGSERQDGVRHRAALVEAHRAHREVLAKHRPQRVLTLGGDCAVEVASVAHLAGQYAERLFVLWIDAHGDLNTPASSPSGAAHGMPLRLLLDAAAEGALPAPGCLTPGQVALVGVRDLDPAEVEYVHRHDLTVVDCATLGAQPTWLAELPPPGAAVYVHLDLDVLDPSALPAVAVPTPGGLTAAALARSLTALRAHHQVVGVGITEYVPQVEHDQRVLGDVLEALGLVGERQVRRP